MNEERKVTWQMTLLSIWAKQGFVYFNPTAVLSPFTTMGSPGPWKHMDSLAPTTSSGFPSQWLILFGHVYSKIKTISR